MNGLKIKEIINCIEKVAPLQWQENYDNSGLIIGNKENYCSGVLICLDVFASTLEEAINKNCNLIISHHPFIFNSIKKIEYGSEIEKILSLAIRNNVAIYSAHTNMDNALYGVNNSLGKLLQLKNIFPLDNSRYCEESYLGSGAIGELNTNTQVKDYLFDIKKSLNIEVIKYCGDINKNIKKVGFCGGAGSFLIEKAIEKDCDIFLTGDLKYHDFLTYEKRIFLADIGHFESENCIKQIFFDIISKNICNFAPVYITEEKNRIKFL